MGKLAGGRYNDWNRIQALLRRCTGSGDRGGLGAAWDR
jgi:hypothetical protein